MSQTFSVTGQGISILGSERHPVFVTTPPFCHGTMKAAPAQARVWPATGRAAPIKLYLWRLKSEFHKISPCQERLFFAFFLPLRNLRTTLILSLWALQKQEVDQIWRSGLSCQAHTCALEDPFLEPNIRSYYSSPKPTKASHSIQNTPQSLLKASQDLAPAYHFFPWFCFWFFERYLT